MRRSVVLLVVVVVAVWSSNPAAAAADDDDIKDEIDGGFSTLDGMLNWAIGHSDPANLQMKAQQLSSSDDDELVNRQLEFKELYEKLEQQLPPSDTQIMQTAILDLTNSSLSFQHHLRALHQLSILVEDIHNANAMHNMGALPLLIQGFTHSHSLVRIACASILGKASQNNPLVQNQLLQLGALPKLIIMVTSTDIEEALKALYAISAIIRNNQNGIHSFYTQAGHIMLQAILGNATSDVRLHKRSLSLVADLAEYQLNNPQQEVPSFLNSCALVRLLTTADDLDLQEKILLAVKNLLMLKSTQQVVAVDGFCGLKEALERITQKLQNLNTEYASDVQGLCKEVNMIYLEKLNKVSQVPT